MDGDTYGVGATVTGACSIPPAHATRAGDCDDEAMDVFPGATELCNGRNDDCDASIDEGLVFAEYYTDRDGDGYGDGPAIPFCVDPGAEFAAMDGDCNDDSDAVRPGLPEICDTLNNDCVGTHDDEGACRSDCTAVVDAGKVYQFCQRENTSWDGANDRCNRLGDGGLYRLAIVGDPEEQRFLANQATMLSDGRNWWIGLTDRENEGTFVWVDGSPRTYDNFAPGESNDDGTEDCVQMYSSGLWNGNECWRDSYFICESIDSI